MLDGVAAVEYEWRVEPTTEQAEKAPPGYRFTTRRRYAVRDGRMYAIWVMGTLDAGQEKAWARVVESFTFFQRSSPLSPP